jgi:uncharacterized membrane protein
MTMAARESRNAASRALTLFLALLAIMLFAVSSPAGAHKGHKHAHSAEVRHPESSPSAFHAPPASPSAMANDDHVDRSNLSTTARLLDWLGRFHPVIVHFPIAFFPAALFTAIVGRRRPAFAAPVRFLVIAGGFMAPLAAILGWLDAMSADPDPLLTVHRWLGTAIGFSALGLGIWAWRRPDQIRGVGMRAALTVVTAAIIVQGWFGGAMVHGIDHLSW